VAQSSCSVPAHVLFPQLVHVIQRYIDTKVVVYAPAHKKDLFLAPYYGWLVERLAEAIHPDTAQGKRRKSRAMNRVAGRVRRRMWTSGRAGTYGR